MNIDKIKKDYPQYNFSKQHARDKIFMGVPIHFDKETGKYIEPPFWNELRKEWKQLSIEEFGYEPCGQFLEDSGIVCQNKQEIVEEDNGVCSLHQKKKPIKKIQPKGTGYLHQVGMTSIQSCDVCILPNKEEICPYFKNSEWCYYETNVYNDVIDKLKSYSNNKITPFLEVKIAQLAINIVLNMRASLLLSKNMYVFDGKASLDLHPAFRVFKDTTQKIDNYITSIEKMIQEVQHTDMDNISKISYFTDKITEEKHEEDISAEEIEKMIQEDIEKSRKNKISENSIDDWKKIKDIFDDE